MAMQKEGQQIVDGIATSGGYSVVMINGYGFPRWRGPMFLAGLTSQLSIRRIDVSCWAASRAFNSTTSSDARALS